MQLKRDVTKNEVEDEFIMKQVSGAGGSPFPVVVT